MSGSEESSVRGRIRTLRQHWSEPGWWTGTAYPFVATWFNNRCHDLFLPEACDVLAEDWDNLFLLDACRYDTFADRHCLDGTLESRISHAPWTPEFLTRNVAGGTFHDTVYVTAMPIYRVEEWVPADIAGAFHDVIDVWQWAWDPELGTVPPETMAAAIERAHERYPRKRLLAHFSQPHHPFVGPTGRSIDERGMRAREMAIGRSVEDSGRNVWELLRAGELDPGRARQAYEENLELALEQVGKLVDRFDGRTVVTADHGNHFGEIVLPVPVRKYGHPRDTYSRTLLTVPWLVVEGTERKPVEAETPVERTNQEGTRDAIRDRLSDLGYV